MSWCWNAGLFLKLFGRNYNFQSLGTCHKYFFSKQSNASGIQSKRQSHQIAKRTMPRPDECVKAHMMSLGTWTRQSRNCKFHPKDTPNAIRHCIFACTTIDRLSLNQLKQLVKWFWWTLRTAQVLPERFKELHIYLIYHFLNFSPVVWIVRFFVWKYYLDFCGFYIMGSHVFLWWEIVELKIVT